MLSTPSPQIEVPGPAADISDPLALARMVHQDGYVDFLTTAWARWEAHPHRDPDFFGNPAEDHGVEYSEEGEPVKDALVPPLVPGNTSNRDPSSASGASVAAQCAWYVADRCTPIFGALLPSLAADMAVVRQVIDAFPPRPPDGRLADAGGGGDGGGDAAFYASYALVTHPGHHAGPITAAGYCYLNSAAIIAEALRRGTPGPGDAGDADEGTRRVGRHTLNNSHVPVVASIIIEACECV